MKLSSVLRKPLLGLALIGMGVLPALAATHTPLPVVSHPAASSHHAYVGGHGGYGYHHHHYYGYYAVWPWYFPWAYGYSGAYYGATFLADAPATYVEMAPAGAVVEGQPQPADSWYYCKSPEGYYPYVKTCESGWQAVPAQPPAP